MIDYEIIDGPTIFELSLTPEPANPVPPLCMGMMSFSVSFLPFIGSIMSFLTIFSTDSAVTTDPLVHDNRMIIRKIN